MNREEFDREWTSARRLTRSIAVVGAAAYLAFAGVAMWAIVELVGWVTSK